MGYTRKLNDSENERLRVLTRGAIEMARLIDYNCLVKAYLKNQIRREELLQANKKCEDVFQQYGQNVIRKYGEG